MKVGMYYNNSKVLVEEMPVPEVHDDDLLLKVNACGICGSDIMEWYRIKKAPLVLGHEITGEIVETGKNVKKFKKGDRVFSTHHVPCNECYYCITGHETACETFHTKNNFSPGGFAEYLRVSGKSVDTGTIKLPDDVSYEQGTFIEPLGTVVRGLRRAELKPGDSVLVLGSGLAGLLNINLSKALGAGRIISTDVNDYRLNAAKIFGAEYAFNAKEDIQKLVRNANEGRLADKVIVCTGSLSAMSQALQSVERGGTILFFAVPKPEELVSIDLNPYWRNDISIKTSYGAAPLDNKQALELIRAKNVDVDEMITQRLSLEEIAEGFRLASEGKECLKVVIKPHKNE
ncbi:MAG: zinc-dependent dehydrogenase [archaeon]